MKEKKSLFIIFGGSGDLARRKLYPALFRMFLNGTIQKHFAVIGTSRRSWPDEYYQNIVLESISKVGGANESDRQLFIKHFFYQSNDVNDIDHYKVLKNRASQISKKFKIDDGTWVYYLAMAPKLFGIITSNLANSNFLNGDHPNRLVIEKPFGHDLGSAKELNEQVKQAFAEDDIYRIDHYLGKEIVQNIVPVRFGNLLFKRIWNRNFISNIQVTLAEQVGVESRAGYYENSGAMRDMFQNHITQLVTLLTMEEPKSLSPDDFVASKSQVLLNIKPLTAYDLKHNFIRGQYKSGNEMVGYRSESDVDPNSNTETFVAGKLEIEKGSLADVPIYFRTGKRMKAKVSRIDVVFKNHNSDLYPDNVNNVFTILIDSEQGFQLRYNAKKIGDTKEINNFELERLDNEADHLEIPEAYQRLFHDVLIGDKTNFVQWKELCASWKLTDQVIDYWRDKPLMPTDFYEAGSMGPETAQELLAKDNNYWIY